MTVFELIRKLKQLPSDMPVGIVYDGMDRLDLEYLWISRSGRVLVSNDQAVYSDEDRPRDAPSNTIDGYWSPADGDTV